MPRDYIAPTDYTPPVRPAPTAPTLTARQKGDALADLELHLDGEPAIREEVLHHVQARLASLTPPVYLNNDQVDALLDEWVAAGDLQGLDSLYAPDPAGPGGLEPR